MFCTIAKLWDIDLKITWFFSDINIDNAEKFCEASMLENCISKNRVFLDLVCNFQTASLLMETSGKNCIAIPIVVSEILVGGVATPQMPLTVNGIFLFWQLMAWGGEGAGNTPPKISRITIGMTRNFLVDVGVYKDTKNSN